MSRGQTLAKNTAIFAVGSIGSKLLQFLLLPFYTNVLNPSEYGVIENLQNIGVLLLVMASLSVFEAVFRFAMDKVTDNREVFSIGLYISIIGIAVISAVCFIINAFFPIHFLNLILLYMASNVIRNITSQFVRAIGEVRLYTVDNILQTAIIMVLNIYMLTVMHLGITGYMLGYIIANFISAIFVFFAAGLFRYLVVREIQKSTAISMLKYCLPLVPSGICWFITNSSNRILVNRFINYEAGGLFGAAYKIPSMLLIILGIFFQAWQMSANDEFDKHDINVYYSNTFRNLQAFTLILSGGIILFSQLIIKIVMGPEFFACWRYMPPIVMGIVFLSFAQFLGTIYAAGKKTLMEFITNIAAAVVSIVLNILLINRIGIMGASVTTACCYFTLWILRVFDTRKIVNISYDLVGLIGGVLLMTAMTVIISIDAPFWYIIAPVCYAGIAACNFRSLKNMAVSALGALKNRNK